MTVDQKRMLKIGVLALVVFLLLFGGTQLFKDDKSYDDTYDLFLKIEDARQINPSSSILLQGKNVGNIKAIELLDYSTGLMLTLAIKNGVRIPKSVNVLLNPIVDGQHIDLSFEKMEMPFYENGDTLVINY